MHFGFQNFFGPSTLTLSNRPVCYFWTVLFYTFGPFTLTVLDRSLWHFRTVHFDPLSPPKDRPLEVEWPSTLTHDRLHWPMTVHFGSKDRPLSSLTVHFGSNDRPVWLNTVHFWTDRPLSRDQAFVAQLIDSFQWLSITWHHFYEIKKVFQHFFRKSKNDLNWPFGVKFFWQLGGRSIYFKWLGIPNVVEWYPFCPGFELVLKMAENHI